MDNYCDACQLPRVLLFNSWRIQSRLRTRLSYTTLHEILYSLYPFLSCLII